MSEKFAVIAIGGNALITSKEMASKKHRYLAVDEASIRMADMIKHGDR